MDDNGHSNNVVNKCRSSKHGHEFSYVMIHRPHVELDSGRYSQTGLKKVSRTPTHPDVIQSALTYETCTLLPLVEYNLAKSRDNIYVKVKI